MAKSSKEIQRERHEKGLCSSCSSKARPGKYTCQACADKEKVRYQAQRKEIAELSDQQLEQKAADHKHYDKLKRLNLCPRCRNKALPDSVYCQSCLDRQRARQKAQAEKRARSQAEKQQQLTQQRLAVCECIACGDKQTFRDTRCKLCWTRWQVTEFGQTRHAARKEAGLCTRCGDDATPGNVYCHECLEKKRQKQQAAVAAKKCPSCSKPTDGKHAKCGECRDKLRKQYTVRAATKLCVDCGKEVDRKNKRVCLACSEKRKRIEQRKNRKLKQAALDTYGGPVCVGCGEDTFEILEIDHINNNGGAHRRELFGHNKGGCCSSHFYRWLRDNGWPDGYRVLCPTCNKKSHRKIPLPNEKA